MRKLILASAAALSLMITAASAQVTGVVVAEQTSGVVGCHSFMIKGDNTTYFVWTGDVDYGAELSALARATESLLNQVMTFDDMWWADPSQGQQCLNVGYHYAKHLRFGNIQ